MGNTDVVALRKESVDRNQKQVLAEIIRQAVALRKESVDRNRIIAKEYDWDARRSPQGERG